MHVECTRVHDLDSIESEMYSRGTDVYADASKNGHISLVEGALSWWGAVVGALAGRDATDQRTGRASWHYCWRPFCVQKSLVFPPAHNPASQSTRCCAIGSVASGASFAGRVWQPPDQKAPTAHHSHRRMVTAMVAVVGLEACGHFHHTLHRGWVSS